MLTHNFDADTIFDNQELAQVVTLQEVCKLWGKSPRQVHWAIDRDHVAARKSITGGTWLLLYNSVTSHWGDPVVSIDEWMV